MKWIIYIIIFVIFLHFTCYFFNFDLFECFEKSSPKKEEANDEIDENDASSIYEFEPSEEEILNDLLPRNLATQLYSSQIESTASELAARMTAMDNATRNAGEMIDNLTLQYNRTRQAVITKELIEIISGAEAL